jgi:membrane protease YdiL (CAAX protease family)
MYAWIDLKWNSQFEMASILPIISFAIIEELIFRGIIFQALVERFGMITISLLFALLFSMAHLANPNFEPIAMLNTFLVSLVFSYSWYHTRGLWLPILLHISWNLMLYLMGMTLSGMVLKNSLYLTSLSSEIPTPWLNSYYGIEGTVYCTIVLILFFPIIQMLPQSPIRMAKLFRLNYAINDASSAGEMYED